MFECRQVNFIYLEFSITEDSIILCGNFKSVHYLRFFYNLLLQNLGYHSCIKAQWQSLAIKQQETV